MQIANNNTNLSECVLKHQSVNGQKLEYRRAKCCGMKKQLWR